MNESEKAFVTTSSPIRFGWLVVVLDMSCCIELLTFARHKGSLYTVFLSELQVSQYNLGPTTCHLCLSVSFQLEVEVFLRVQTRKMIGVHLLVGAAATHKV